LLLFDPMRPAVGTPTGPSWGTTRRYPPVPLAPSSAGSSIRPSASELTSRWRGASRRRATTKASYALPLLDAVRDRGFATKACVMALGYDTGPIHDGCEVARRPADRPAERNRVGQEGWPSAYESRLCGS
jgi:hypothetical protein